MVNLEHGQYVRSKTKFNPLSVFIETKLTESDKTMLLIRHIWQFLTPYGIAYHCEDVRESRSKPILIILNIYGLYTDTFRDFSTPNSKRVAISLSKWRSCRNTGL